MDMIIFAMILLSALLHALWNTLVKRSSQPTLFLAVCKVVESLVFLIPFVIYYTYAPYGIEALPWIMVAAVLVFLNYWLLTQAYHRMDMSLVYPVARSSTLFLPALAYMAFGETIDRYGVMAVVLITFGVLAMQLPSLKLSECRRYISSLFQPGMLYALGAAFTVALYTLWDKAAIQHIQPFLYFYSYTLITGAIFSVIILKRYSFTQARTLWCANKTSITVVAIANTAAYLLVLYALSHSKATYVGALRQSSLVFGLMLSCYFLRESLNLPKLMGTLLIALGSVVVFFSS